MRPIQLDLTLTFKIIKGLDAVEPSTWFSLVGEEGGRATSLPLNIIRGAFNTEIRKKNFSNRVIDNWKALPAELKESVAVNNFKCNLKEWLTKNPV